MVFQRFQFQTKPICINFISLSFLKSWVRILRPQSPLNIKIQIPEEFAIMATLRASKHPDGAYLFAIVNSLDTVIQLGVKISASNHNTLNISLVYNDPSSVPPSESLATFTLPYEPKHWINFAIQVLNDRVSLYHNCIKTHDINITKEPKELVFESASTFYLAQSGNLRHRFEVSKVSLNGVGICH